MHRDDDAQNGIRNLSKFGSVIHFNRPTHDIFGGSHSLAAAHETAQPFSS